MNEQSLYSKIKQACDTSATNMQIAAVYGVSTMIVSKVRELSHDFEKIEHPERFDYLGLRIR
jgi:hypothetical protein